MNLHREWKHPVTVATFHDRRDADSLSLYLESQGVETKVQDERRWQRYWFLVRPCAGVHVQVSTEHLLFARQALREWETSVGVQRWPVHCPACRSSRVQYPQMTRKFMTPALVGVLCALKIIPKEFYCLDCHFTWSNEEERTIGRLWHRFFPGLESGKEGS